MLLLAFLCVCSTALRLNQESFPGDAPTFFAYELPWELDGAIVRDEHQCEILPDIACVFGPLLEINVNNDTTITVQDVNQFSLGRIFQFLLMDHPQRVHEPSHAQLFFVPMWNAKFPQQEKCPHTSKFFQHLQHLDKTTIRRHFFLSPRVGHMPDVCHLFNSKEFYDTTKVALEAYEGYPHADPSRKKPNRNFKSDFDDNDFIDEDHRLAQPPGAANMHSIPYPSMLSGFNKKQVEQFQSTVATMKRNYLVSAIQGNHDVGMFGSMQLRQDLEKQCRNSADCNLVSLKGKGKREKTNAEVIVPAMMQSVFCLQPTGDSISRKGMVDSILLGCIPVLFHMDQKKLWPWHVTDWDDVAVYVDKSNQPDTIRYLQQISSSDIARMQANLPHMARVLSYGQPGTGLVGLEKVLAGIAASV